MRLLRSIIGLSYTLGAFSSVLLKGRGGAAEDEVAAVGPDADLYIGNKAISPDGFKRS